MQNSLQDLYIVRHSSISYFSSFSPNFFLQLPRFPVSFLLHFFFFLVGLERAREKREHDSGYQPLLQVFNVSEKKRALLFFFLVCFSKEGSEIFKQCLTAILLPLKVWYLLLIFVLAKEFGVSKNDLKTNLFK